MSILPHTLANGPGHYVDHTKYMDNWLWLFAMAKGNQALNGGFENWSGGTSFTNPAHLASLADNWKLEKTGTAAPTANVDREGTTKDTESYSLKVSISGAGSSDSLLRIRQDISDYARLKGQTLTLGMRVKVGTPSKVRLLITDGLTSQYSTYHTGGGDWELLTVPITCAQGMTNLYIYAEIKSDFAGDPIYIDSCFLYITDPAMSDTARAALYFFVPDGHDYVESGCFDLKPQTSAPTAKIGRIYFNSVDGQFYGCKDGTNWSLLG